jgi:hypothetical protein
MYYIEQTKTVKRVLHNSSVYEVQANNKFVQLTGYEAICKLTVRIIGYDVS